MSSASGNWACAVETTVQMALRRSRRRNASSTSCSATGKGMADWMAGDVEASGKGTTTIVWVSSTGSAAIPPIGLASSANFHDQSDFRKRSLVQSVSLSY